MRGPLVDVVLLTLIVAFFGMQQRRRPEVYFRFWLAGWAFVLASLVIWDLPLEGVLAPTVQDALRQTMLACGGLAFVFSFVARRSDLKEPLLEAALLAVPVCLGLDLVVTRERGGLVVLLLVMAGEVMSAVMVWRYLREGGGWLLAVLLGTCPLFGAGMMAVVLYGHADELMVIALAQTFVVSGLLFSTMKRSGGRTVGAAGFFLWAAVYLLTMWFLPVWVVQAVYSIWTVPKYLVAFGMILKLFTKINAEYAALNARHQQLYEEYRLLFDTNPHPMWIYEFETRRFLSVNDAAVAAYGYTREDFLRMRVDDIVAEEPGVGEDGELLPVEIWDVAGTETRASRHRRADGTGFDVDVTGHAITFAGKDARFVMAVDITEREELNRELVRRAHHDALTGLPNRVMLEDRLNLWLLRCVREENMGAFLTVDIDHFKKVNDTYGHQAGDDCLKVTADRLRSRVRQVDTIARTGGEEFTIVIGGLKTRVGAEKVCAELLKLFEQPVVAQEQEIRLTISIGVALYPEDGVEVDVLRRRSDQALYRAKSSGRNRAVFASDAVVAS